MDAGQRLDIWLFRTRLTKSRTVATQKIEKGRVRLTRHGKTIRVKKPGFKVRLGDLILLPRGRELISAEVLAYPKRRGPAPEAQSHYRVIPAQDE